MHKVYIKSMCKIILLLVTLLSYCISEITVTAKTIYITSYRNLNVTNVIGIYFDKTRKVLINWPTFVIVIGKHIHREK